MTGAWNGWRRGSAVGAAVALAVIGVGGAGTAAHAATACRLPAGDLRVADLAAGTNVTTCGIVGRVVRQGSVGLTIPAAGTAAGVDAITADGQGAGFQIEVAVDGTLSYPQSTQVAAAPATDAAARRDPAACSDAAYSTNDLKEYGTYNWYVGDGGMPGALSQSAAASAFADAINNITGSTNSCGYGDLVDAKSSYKGTTTYEADMNSGGTCTARDQKSTWDAGNLATGTVAQTCWWSTPVAGIKNDLVEADVRYNTTDYSFTDSPSSSCSTLYDVRSVGTHEAGHVFGMGHVGSGHSELTMYTNSFRCTAKARSLGRGDVAGLRSIY